MPTMTEGEEFVKDRKEQIDSLLNVLGAIRDRHCDIIDVLDGPGYPAEKLDRIREINDTIGTILRDALPG